MRSAITSLVYRKSVRISSSARSKFSTGEIINYQAIDATRLAFVTPLLHSVCFVNFIYTNKIINIYAYIYFNRLND